MQISYIISLKCGSDAALFVLIASLTLLAPAPQASASDVDGLAECNINVFQEIAKTHAWSGKTDGCIKGRVLVEKRETGAFVTAWKIVKSGDNWEKLALSTAMGYQELVDKKLFKNAVIDIKVRSKRLKSCLDSIVGRNDPGECQDTAKKIYSAGDVSGIDMERTIWLNDNGRHVVLGFSHGNSSLSDTVPADLEKTPGIPPGVRIDIKNIMR